MKIYKIRLKRHPEKFIGKNGITYALKPAPLKVEF